jgi:hypothetical protein
MSFGIDQCKSAWYRDVIKNIKTFKLYRGFKYIVWTKSVCKKRKLSKNNNNNIEQIKIRREKIRKRREDETTNRIISSIYDRAADTNDAEYQRKRQLSKLNSKMSYGTINILLS